MKLAEVHQLLIYVAAIDNRRVTDDAVVAWHGILADLELSDCREAVRRHFASTTDYLMPAHVRRQAAEIDRERRRRAREADEAQQRALEAHSPTRDRSVEVRALLAELRRRLPAADERNVRRAEVIDWDRARARLTAAVPNPHYDPTVTPSDVEEQAS